MKTSNVVAIVVSLFLLFCGCSNNQGHIYPSEPEDLRDSIVRIKGTYLDVLTGEVVTSSGSAVIVKKDKGRVYALTAKHVVDTRVRTKSLLLLQRAVFPRNGEEFSIVHIEYIHPSADAALISFKRTETLVKVAEISYKAPRIPDKIYAIGYPSGVNRIVTTSNIAGKCGDLFDCEATGPRGEGYILDEPQFPGMSGGGAFSEDGKLIGIVTSNRTIVYRVRGKRQADVAWGIFISTRAMKGLLREIND